MYTDKRFDQLEREERSITDEAILFMLALLAAVKSDLEQELRSFYSKYGKDGVVTWQEARKWVSGRDHRKRLTVMLVYINDHFNELYSKLSPEFKSMLTSVIGKESEFFDVEIPEDVADKPWGVEEMNWDERLVNDVILWAAYLGSDLKQALVKRLTIDELIEKVEKRFNTMGTVLTTLALSESTAIGTMARRQAFRELGITRYRFYTRADERTCEICGSMHGIEFPISAFEVGVTASPLHPRCRCWEVPVWD